MLTPGRLIPLPQSQGSAFDPQAIAPAIGAFLAAPQATATTSV